MHICIKSWFFGFFYKKVQQLLLKIMQKNYTVGGYQIVPKNQLSIF
jgi:hypothetical protein